MIGEIIPEVAVYEVACALPVRAAKLAAVEVDNDDTDEDTLEILEFAEATAADTELIFEFAVATAADTEAKFEFVEANDEETAAMSEAIVDDKIERPLTVAEFAGV